VLTEAGTVSSRLRRSPRTSRRYRCSSESTEAAPRGRVKHVASQNRFDVLTVQTDNQMVDVRVVNDNCFYGHTQILANCLGFGGCWRVIEGRRHSAVRRRRVMQPGNVGQNCGRRRRHERRRKAPKRSCFPLDTIPKMDMIAGHEALRRIAEMLKLNGVRHAHTNSRLAL